MKAKYKSTLRIVHSCNSGKIKLSAPAVFSQPIDSQVFVQETGSCFRFEKNQKLKPFLTFLNIFELCRIFQNAHYQSITNLNFSPSLQHGQKGLVYHLNQVKKQQQPLPFSGCSGLVSVSINSESFVKT